MGHHARRAHADEGAWSLADQLVPVCENCHLLLQLVAALCLIDCDAGLRRDTRGAGPKVQAIYPITAAMLRGAQAQVAIADTKIAGPVVRAGRAE